MLLYAIILIWYIHMEDFSKAINKCRIMFIWYICIEDFSKAINKCCIIFIWYIPMEDFSKLVPKCGHKPSISLEYSYGRLYVIMWH